MARPHIFASVQLPHVGNQRLWKFYRPNDFEPCGFFERGLCRCQNGQTYSRSRNKGAFDFSWKECLVIAAIASVLNGVAHSMLYDNAVNWILIIGYSSGDMAGQIVLLFLMIALMRLNRKLSKFI